MLKNNSTSLDEHEIPVDSSQRTAMSLQSESMSKKPISDRRRMQNKQAQKKYRERQKRDLQVLQDIAMSSHNLRIDASSSSMDIQNVEPTNDSPRLGVNYDASLTRSQWPVFSEPGPNMVCFGGSAQSPGILDTNQQPPSLPQLPINSEMSRGIGTIRGLLEQEGISLGGKTLISVSGKTMSLQRIFEAGLKAISNETSLEADSNLEEEECGSEETKLLTDNILVLNNSNGDYKTPLADIRLNHIRIKQVNYVAACITNASYLGFSFELDDSCEMVESPFFRDAFSESAAKTACLNEFGNLETYLRPTAAQMVVSHHPYIDVLPFPTFRDRIIKLAYVEEPMIDEEELCRDLANDGLVCWGSSLGGGSRATGSGAPWDIRSWEAQPWFLKKWWILIGGAEGEIYKQTQWWCEMRGERFCNPW